jgi:uncharacterized protein YndB with AHSA1/START domain
MSVKKDPSGRRFVEAEVEVPGTPEQVWQAIATGPGVSSWFVPTEIRGDGAVVSHFGPGMDAVARQTAWDPPNRFAAEGDGFAPNAPPLATEWTVEAKSGGTCIVRVVHSLFTSDEDWDNQLESIESGWPAFFRILRLYLTHFPGQHGSMFQLIGQAKQPPPEAWKLLTDSLGLTNAAIGEHRRTSPGAPTLGGIVEAGNEAGHPNQLLLRLDEPGPGLVHLYTLNMCGNVYVVVRMYLYGESAIGNVAREEPIWQAFVQQLFPH